jgi:hypothetical protein
VTIRVRVQNTAELRRLARRFRAAADGGLQRDLTAQITREGRPVLKEVQAAVQALEVGSTKGGTARPDTSTGLRGRLAAATDVTPEGVGIRFEVHGMRVDPKYGHRLAKLTDTTLAPRWRHPVFQVPWREHTKWTTSTGKPWFFVTIRDAEPKFRAAVLRAMATTARKIMG